MSDNCTSNCSTCGKNCESRKEKNEFLEPMNKDSRIKKVIGVVSGKGGVGKSLVTSLLASEMKRKGYGTAILDADITGPSIPKAFGINGRAKGNEDGIFPSVSEGGVKIMSLNLLVNDVTDPVVWRGPIIAGTVKQFWTDVMWGDVDYMFVDMPPGTGDVPLTVFQSLPVDGIVIVTSPQELVNMIVEKAVKMAGMMNIPVYGIVENMSYFKCPDCGSEHYIFGESKTEATAAKYDIDTVIKLHIYNGFASACDNGTIEKSDVNWLDKLTEKIENI